MILKQFPTWTKHMCIIYVDTGKKPTRKEIIEQMIKLQVDFEDLKKENEKLRQQSASIGQLIDNKIDEFKNGDYGDLPCNTIHMFLDLKQEMRDLE